MHYATRNLYKELEARTVKETEAWKRKNTGKNNSDEDVSGSDHSSSETAALSATSGENVIETGFSTTSSSGESISSTDNEEIHSEEEGMNMETSSG